MFDYKERDKLIFQILDNAPVAVKHFVLLGIFFTIQAAYRRFIRLENRSRGRKPRCVGLVAFHDEGRPAKVYCSYRSKALEHEAFLSDELIRCWPWIPFTSWKRGINTDSVMRPDAEIPGLMIEYDRGNERKRQIQRQAEAYRDYTGLVVWIVPEMKQVDWVNATTNKENTLYKLHGSSTLFDCQGREVIVEKLCRQTLVNFQHPMGCET